MIAHITADLPALCWEGPRAKIPPEKFPNFLGSPSASVIFFHDIPGPKEIPNGFIY